jgi:hypothetical protein
MSLDFEDPETFTALYNEAIRISHTAEPTDDDAFVDSVASLCADAAQAQATLRDNLLAELPAKVKAAASKGKFSATILEFAGADKFDDNFSYLFLLKGPRDLPQQNDLAARGFVPLYTSLYYRMSPFLVNFQWTPGTNLNSLTVSWLPRS